MNQDELRSMYNEAYKIIYRERKMRARVFAARTVERQGKLAEMDRLLEIMDAMKNELKERLEADDYEQPTLLDVPRRVEYR